MIRSPTPRLEARKCPAESRVPNPLPIGEGRPAIANAEGPPAKAVSSAIRPRTVGIEAAEAGRVVRRICVLHGGRSGGGNRVDLSGNPMIEFVLFRNAADAHGRFVAGFHREQLPFCKRRGLVLMQYIDVARNCLDRAAVVKIIEAERGAASGLNGEITATDAEIIAAHRIYVEGSAALPQDQAS